MDRKMLSNIFIFVFVFGLVSAGPILPKRSSKRYNDADSSVEHNTIDDRSDKQKSAVKRDTDSEERYALSPDTKSTLEKQLSDIKDGKLGDCGVSYEKKEFVEGVLTIPQHYYKATCSATKNCPGEKGNSPLLPIKTNLVYLIKADGKLVIKTINATTGCYCSDALKSSSTISANPMV